MHERQDGSSPGQCRAMLTGGEDYPKTTDVWKPRSLIAEDLYLVRRVYGFPSRNIIGPASTACQDWRFRLALVSGIGSTTLRLARDDLNKTED